MGRIGMTVSKKDPGTSLAGHFGVAKWVMVHDPEAGTTEYLRNEGLHGRAVADLMAAHGCTDAIVGSIGAGALGHLRQHGIRTFHGPSDRPVMELVAALGRGELPVAEQASHAGGGHHHHHHHR